MKLALQFHNLAEGRAAEYDLHLQSFPRALGAGLLGLQRYSLSPAQMPRPAPAAQPYHGVTLFELDDAMQPEMQAALAEQLRIPHGNGVLVAERTHLFDILRDRVPSFARSPAGLPDHLLIVMANYTPGMRDQWCAWYDEVHGQEWLGSLGVDAYTRGLLADPQLDPEAEQPAGGLVIYHFKTRDFQAALTEALARATGTSASGIKWSGRSPAVLNSTTYGFDPAGPRLMAE